MIDLPAARLWAGLLLPLLAFLAACSGANSSAEDGATPTGMVADLPVIEGEVTIFAAASLTEAFTEMKAELETANAGATITLNFAGSSALRTQLAEGAPADVYASADEANMDGAQADGTIDGEPRIFAENRLVAIVPSDNPAGIEALADLAQPGIKLVLAQAQVPIGIYSRQALEKMAQDPQFGAAFDDQVLANLVSEEANVKQVVAKVQLGEADAGIVYASDVTPAVRPDVKIIDIPDDFNVLAEYPIAVVAEAPNAEGAAAFIEYVLSPAGQSILSGFGFIPIENQAREQDSRE